MVGNMHAGGWTPQGQIETLDVTTLVQWPCLVMGGCCSLHCPHIPHIQTAVGGGFPGVLLSPISASEVS